MRWKMCELLDLRGDGGADLETAGAGADKCEPGPADIQVLGQRAEWNDGPAKVSMPGISGSRGRLSEPTALMTKRASNTFSAPLVSRAVTRHMARSSCHSTSVDRGVEAAVRPEVELVDDGTEVVAQLRLLAVVLAPQLGRLEGEAVLMAPDVDTCAGVAVLPPGAARTLVLVDDRKGQSRLLEADAGQDPAHPATDDDDGCRGLLGLRDLVAPGDLSAVPALELQVVEETGRPAGPRRDAGRGSPSSPATDPGTDRLGRTRRRDRRRSPGRARRRTSAISPSDIAP